MASNPEFLKCNGERKQESFFKVLNSVDISSEKMRAIPHDFARSFSEKELLGKMKIRASWGSSWEVKISKNPRFYFMEKSGWEKFVRDNALGRNEFLIFTHKGRMQFSVNIMKQFGKEMLLPPQSRAFLASSSRLKTEQDVKAEEVVVSSELSSRGPRTAAESNGGGMYKRKFNFGKKKAEESQYSKKTERVVSIQRDYAGASSSSIPGFNIFISKSYLIYLAIPKSASNDYMPRVQTMLKIHHPDGKKSWDVGFRVTKRVDLISGGWRRLCRFWGHLQIHTNQTTRASSSCLKALREANSQMMMDVTVS